MQGIAASIQLDSHLYNLLMDAAGAVGTAMVAERARAGVPVPAPPPLLQVKRGKAESAAWFLVQATEFEPEPLTVANLRVRDVYGSERVVAALLELMAVEGYLARDEQSAYYLTDAGREILNRRGELSIPHLQRLQPIPTEQIERLANLLWRLLDASLHAGRSIPPWCLAHSRRRAPPAEAGPLAGMMQYFDDFNAFRDDAHMAAWQPLGVQGYIWEAFSHVCDDIATSSAALWEKLAHRGYSRCDYAAALAECAQRGWLRRTNGDAYTATDAGKRIRDEAEWRTDDYFYTPWRALSDGEIAETHKLLVGLRDGAAAIAAEVIPAR